MREMKLISKNTIGLAAILLLAPLTLPAQNESPKGWVGVLITTGIGEANSAGRLIFRDYPVIESIDPGSPAEKAGLRAGDILISINSQDFKLNPIPMDELLVPGRKITFRYRRDNSAKVSRMTVAVRPAGTTAGREIVIRSLPDLPRVADRRATEDAVRQVRIRDGGLLAPSVSIAPLVFGNGTPSIALLGAELTRLNEDLRNALNVRGDGVFVVNVAVGSPAGESGLKGGDVIVAAAKQLLQNPGQLYRLIEMATGNSLSLSIVRAQKQQNLVLRW
jgi:S1-C subfamily serine protease